MLPFSYVCFQRGVGTYKACREPSLGLSWLLCSVSASCTTAVHAIAPIPGIQPTAVTAGTCRRGDVTWYRKSSSSLTDHPALSYGLCGGHAGRLKWQQHAQPACWGRRIRSNRVYRVHICALLLCMYPATRCTECTLILHAHLARMWNMNTT